MSCEKIKLYYFNYVTDDLSTLTPSSEDTNFPVSNLKTPLRTKVFRSTSSSCNIVIDTATTEQISDLLVLPSSIDNQFGFTGDLTIEANATNSWSSPAFSTTLTPNRENNFGIATFDTAQSYRFWRVSASSGASYAELADVFLGKAFTPGKNVDFNWTYSEKDISKITSNRYGQKYIDKITTLKEESLSIKFLTKDELEDFYSFANFVGKNKPFYIVLDNGESFSPNREFFAGKFYLRSDITYTNVAYNYYNLNMRVEECT